VDGQTHLLDRDGDERPDSLYTIPVERADGLGARRLGNGEAVFQHSEARDLAAGDGQHEGETECDFTVSIRFVFRREGQGVKDRPLRSRQTLRCPGSHRHRR